MREILFRGFYEYKNGKETIYINGKEIKGKWVYGDLVKCMTDNGECIGIKDTIFEVNTNRCNLIPNIVIPETIGQFTGLTDKNGKKIFEGDIVNYQNTDGIKFNGVALTIIGKVVYNEKNASFAVCGKDEIGAKHYDYFPIKNIENIGNIHDNPELLRSDCE